MNYNYSLYNYREDFLAGIIHGLGEKNDVCVFSMEEQRKSRLISKLHFLHWSNKINQIIKLPLKRIWYSSMYKHSWPESKPTCFIFYGAKYAADDLNYLSYIKKRNPQNKIVLIFGDLVQKKKLRNQDKLFQMADLVLSYDPGECRELGMIYFESLYYMPILPITMPTEFKYDVFFLGYAKDRLEMIHDTWRHLSEQGINCKFMIAGVDQDQRLEGVGLEYIDKPISYKENLQYVQESRCVLELIQGQSEAVTLRALEAVCYKRKLISNSPAVKNSIVYCPGNMLTFSDLKEIKPEFATSPVDYKAYESVHTLTSEDYINRIEELLMEADNANI